MLLRKPSVGKSCRRTCIATLSLGQIHAINSSSTRVSLYWSILPSTFIDIICLLPERVTWIGKSLYDTDRVMPRLPCMTAAMDVLTGACCMCRPYLKGAGIIALVDVSGYAWEEGIHGAGMFSNACSCSNLFQATQKREIRGLPSSQSRKSANLGALYGSSW